MYQLEITVTSVKGECYAGCRVGDKFTVEDPVVKSANPLCLYALSAMMPYLTVAYRQTPPDDWINHVAELQCPDATNTVKFQIRRIES